MPSANLKNSAFDLGDLADPDLLHETPNIENIDTGTLTHWLTQMIRIRYAEEKISEHVESGVIRCPCHLAIGQEAPPVVLASYIEKGDKLFGAHRSHAHYLSLGGDMRKLFAEILGKETGCSKGMGGSMHLIDKENGLFGTVPIVGATIPMATGAALASKISGDKSIAVSFLGDGATEEGVFQESMNLAASQEIPVIYFVENNLFASHLHIDLRQPSWSVCRFAEANIMEWTRVEGNNVAELNEALKGVVSNMRNDSKPHLLEVITYRWKGHVGHRDDIDVGVARKESMVGWKKRDAIQRLFEAMKSNGNLDEEGLEKIKRDARSEIDNAWEQAAKDPYPQEEALLERVYYKS